MTMVVGSAIEELEEGQEVIVCLTSNTEIGFDIAHARMTVIGWDKMKHRVFARSKGGHIMGLPNSPGDKADKRTPFFTCRESAVEHWNTLIDRGIDSIRSTSEARIAVLERGRVDD